ncbi:hypothetical protein LINPERHAP1_LOCUS33060 [Linum perenne]
MFSCLKSIRRKAVQTNKTEGSMMMTRFQLCVIITEASRHVKLYMIWVRR